MSVYITDCCALIDEVHRQRVLIAAAPSLLREARDEVERLTNLLEKQGRDYTLAINEKENRIAELGDSLFQKDPKLAELLNYTASWLDAYTEESE